MLFHARGRTVTYRHGTEEHSIEAVPAGVSWNEIQRTGASAFDASRRDYIVKTSAMPRIPVPKDEIVDGDEVWKVCAIAGEECSRPLKSCTNLLRIHCKK